MPFATRFLILLLPALPSCCIFVKRPQGTPPPYFSLRTPEATFRSFQEAVRRGNDEKTEYRCLSNAFLKEANIGWGDYQLGRERFFREHPELLELVRSARLVTAEPVEPGRRVILRVRGGEERGLFELVNEPGYDVYVEGDDTSAEGAGPRPDEALDRSRPGEAILRYPMKPDDVPAGERVTEVRIADRWRFYKILDLTEGLKRKIEG